MISKEAKDISFVFSQLRDLGFKVFNFNTGTPATKRMGSIKKLTDFIIVGNDSVHFIEVKLKSTKDTFKPEQLELKEMLQGIQSEAVVYWTVDSLDTAHIIFENIVQGDWE
jgi:hypothetical protein